MPWTFELGSLFVTLAVLIIIEVESVIVVSLSALLVETCGWHDTDWF